jgi:hypothetical protein
MLGRPTNSPTRGMTMIELVLAVGMLVAIFAALSQTLMSGSGAYQATIDRSDLEAKGERLLTRIVAELRDADRSLLWPNPTGTFGASTLEYRPCEGWAGGARVHGPTHRLQLVLEGGELDNGSDDNGNGLVDEQRLVLVPDTTLPAQIVPLGSGFAEFLAGEIENGADDNGNGLVDERGLSFASDGGPNLTIRLTLVRGASGGRVLTGSYETTLRLRNE